MDRMKISKKLIRKTCPICGGKVSKGIIYVSCERCFYNDPKWDRIFKENAEVRHGGPDDTETN